MNFSKQRLLNRLIDWDSYVLHLVNTNQKQIRVRKIFYLISRSGDAYIYCLIPLIYLIYFPEIGRPMLIILLIAFSIDLPIYFIVKNTTCRVRPFENLEKISQLIQPPDKFSFPSGHTAAAFLFATIISSFVPAMAYIVFPWAILLGISRVFLGIHYPTDIIAGVLLGMGSAFSAFIFYEFIF